MLQRYLRNKPFLERSKFRSSFKLDSDDITYINQKGLQTIKQHAHDFIKQRLAPENPEKDGKQTPYKGHPVFKAQHAIGVCCRSCLEKWYNIPKRTELTEDQISNISTTIAEWIKEQLRS